MAGDNMVWIRHQVAIAGRISDAQTNASMAGARVRIVAAPAQFTEWLERYRRQHSTRWDSMSNRPDQYRTKRDGHFHFLDLPAGDYRLEARAWDPSSRHGGAAVDVAVEHDGEDIQLASADMSLPPTTLSGDVGAPDEEGDLQPVPMAQIRVQGSGEKAFTDDTGHYLLPGLEIGTRTVTVSARGYQTPDPQTVSFAAAGDEQTMDWVLDPT